MAAGIAQQCPGVPQLDVVAWLALVAVRLSCPGGGMKRPGHGGRVGALLAQPVRQAGSAARRAGGPTPLPLTHDANRRAPTFQQTGARLAGG